MTKQKRFVAWFYRTRSTYWRNNRILYPSPAEVAFVRVMGGRTITLPYFRHQKTGFPITLFLTLGRTLKAHKFKREVRVGKHYCDFGNDIKWIIEIDSDLYHGDIVREKIRDDYLLSYGCRILHIRAPRIYRNPGLVKNELTKWLSD